MSEKRYPQGWYYLLASKEVPKNKIIPLKFFDKSFAIGRDSNGKLELFDAHCPHLGAHLGYGGKFEGEHIVCPYHGFKHKVDQRCAKGFKIKSWTVKENKGMIFFWYGPRENAPIYELPNFNGLTKKLLTLNFRKIIVNASITEIIENMPDLDHYIYVHKMRKTKISKYEIKDHKFIFNFNIDTKATFLEDKKSLCKNICYGPGVLWVELTNTFNMYEIILLTPIDKNRTQFVQSFMIPKFFNPLKFIALYLPLIYISKRELKKDQTLWENKIQGGNDYQLFAEKHIFQLREWVNSYLIPPPN
ncbi:MAG: Rieske 2Fe-2S domain-containing protein [Bacteriovoracaceae bacterium]